MKILLPHTMPLSPVLPDGWYAEVVDARQPIPAEHRDAAALVVWGASPQHVESAVDLPDLRLVQALSAGVDHLAGAGFAESVAICSGTGLHSATVTEHTLALLLTLIRRLPDARDAQDRHEWSADLGGLQPLHPTDRVTTLLDARVLIWGFGQIAQTLAPLLAALGATVTGVARTAGTRAGFPVIAAADLDSHLADTDILISILPSLPDNANIIGAEVFAALPDRALVINVGRGAVLDQAALAEALRAGRLAGAALDVTNPEPLPPNDPLWDTPRLLITPHAAGGRPVGADDRIAQNVAALVAGAPLIGLVHR